MKTENYAHSLPGKPIADWQPLDEHLARVAKLASGFAIAFNSADWAWNAGWLHDLGKAAPEFQNYLREQNGLDGLDDSQYDEMGHGRINHSSAGAALAERHPASGRVLAYLVAGHHAGLTDYEAGEAAGHGALRWRIREGKDLLSRIAIVTDEVTESLRILRKAPTFIARDRDGGGVHLWVRMLFSCLVDADYLDTETFMKGKAAPIRGDFPEMHVLKEAFDQYMGRLVADADKTPINAIRQEVLAASRAAGSEYPGLFSMNVPTGGGKTLASMGFALEHAVRHGKERIIYVIPYTSIIEQTANVFRAVFKDVIGGEAVIEHHSNLDPEKETQRSRLAAENWDAPIIVTTNVQFLESLYAARPSRCRKLHNIVNSVVILDEAQLLPTQWLAPCVDVINRLTGDYGVTVVLSTATQPSLPGLDPAREIVPNIKKLHADLKRVHIRMPTDLRASVSWELMADELSGREQVLCIVSSRRDCRELYDTLCTRVPEGTVIHLSALMCGEHRSRVIEQIKWRLQEKLPTRVVSTQLVEAGVDLDFPVVYRALAGLDSIAQAAGRCNREGKLPSGRLGEVVVFIPPKDPYDGLLRKGVDTTRELTIGSNFDPQDPGVYTRYFELFYSKANDTGKKWLHERLVKDVRMPDGPQMQFRTAAEEFKLIDDTQQPVIVRYGDSEKWIERLRAAGPTREIMRRLQRFTVNVPRYKAADMLRDGKLEQDDNGILVQIMPGIYREEVGLDIFGTVMPIEDFMQ